MMSIDMNTKGFISTLPWTLPFLLLLPFGLIVSDLRGLRWAWETGYAPFWVMLGLLFILAAFSSFLLWKLQEIGATLYRVGIFLATCQTTYLAMSERRHSLLILIFLLFTAAVLISEKMKKVMRLPYYASKRSWWESYPKGLPGLSVELSGKNGDTSKGRLANFGAEGCFVFSVTGEIPFAPTMVRIFSGKEALLEAEVEPVLRTRDGFGWGLRFDPSAIEGDWSKDLQDYLGFLRRSGYDVA
jgi:hypothetical protein